MAQKLNGQSLNQSQVQSYSRTSCMQLLSKLNFGCQDLTDRLLLPPVRFLACTAAVGLAAVSAVELVPAGGWVLKAAWLHTLQRLNLMTSRLWQGSCCPCMHRRAFSDFLIHKHPCAAACMSEILGVWICKKIDDRLPRRWSGSAFFCSVSCSRQNTTPV